LCLKGDSPHQQDGQEDFHHGVDLSLQVTDSGSPREKYGGNEDDRLPDIRVKDGYLIRPKENPYKRHQTRSQTEHMKHTFFPLFLLATLTLHAQPKLVEKAIVKMQTEITFPENMGGGNSPGGEGGGDRFIMMGGAGGMESTSTMYFKGDMTKVENTTDFGNNIVITDRKSGKTTTLTEAMGKKTGFYTTPEDDKKMRARMDSARELRRDSLQKMGINVAPPAKPQIEYTEETKKIAGYVCKKAIIKSPGQRGQPSTTEVWYCPEFKLAGGSPSGGGGGRGMMAMAGVNGLDQLEGFPMEYRIERGNGMKMHMQVTKVQLDASIDDRIFEIPKGYELKPMSEMMQGGGNGRMFMMRSNN
jgi:hypothetical protein